MSQTLHIAALPGDGIGPEVMAQSLRVLECCAELDGFALQITQAPIGGAGYDAAGIPLPDETLALAERADAVLLGAVGGPQYDTLDRSLRPERALLGIRAALGLYANLRPALVFPALTEASSLHRHLVENLDILIVRELTGGIYFGQPRGFVEEEGVRVGYNTMRYSEMEVERIARNAFEAAQVRDKRLCSVDKANVLEVSELWREVVTRVGADYPEVELSHLYVDNAAMQLVRAPKQFDVIVTGNLFGDILSDIAAMLTGSIGMLPSASLDANGKGMYEPVHGSAPDIAGKDIANPIAAILSAAMMLRYSFGIGESADRIEYAVNTVLNAGVRTADIARDSDTVVSGSAMGDAIVAALRS
ncbi:3-isopropylmalate dehydrogenase [Gammaproteobacteria bacterium]|nr:3-isopropylmalate dehydrogenase [Gammaproteobacteria bacterium]